MKTSIFTCLIVLFFSFLSRAGVMVTPNGIFVKGSIEGDGTLAREIGETIDYLTFEVTNTGPVQLIATDITSSLFLAMGIVVGGDEPFDIVTPPYLLFTNHSITNPPQFTHILDPGIYVVQVAVEEYRDGDLGDGFVPVQDTDAIITIPSPYSFALEGQFQALDFMEGNLDGTFTVTHVPEPSTATLLCMAAAAGLIGGRHQAGKRNVSWEFFPQSARWGYMDTTAISVPFTKTDSNYLPTKAYGNWDRNTAYIVNTWLPQRRAYYLGRMQTIGLYQP